MKKVTLPCQLYCVWVRKSRRRKEGEGDDDLKKMKSKKDEKIHQTVLSVCETNLSWRGRLKERGEASKDEEEGEVAQWSI